jgi:HEAT repeat protein
METGLLEGTWMRSAVLLSAALSLCACSSVGPEEGEPDPAALKEKREAEEAALNRGQFYMKVNQMTDAWAAAYAEPGLEAKGRARALETAISREVWGRFEEALKDLQESDNPRFRASAARGLGFVANPRVRPALEQALGDPDASVLAAALVSLGRIADPGTDDRQVVKLLTFPDRQVQGGAALCLARIFQSRRLQDMAPMTPSTRVQGTEVDLVLLLFDKEDPIVRGNAAQALGGLGSPDAEQLLLNRVRDDSPFVRLKAAQALATTGTPVAYDQLLDSLGRETEENIKIVTALAIGSIAERDGMIPPLHDLKVDAGAWRKWLKK